MQNIDVFSLSLLQDSSDLSAEVSFESTKKWINSCSDADHTKIIMNGSMNQSLRLDTAYMKENSCRSFFATLEALVADAGVVLSRLLLEDIQNGAAEGVSFEAGLLKSTIDKRKSFLESDLNSEQPLMNLCDTNKVLLLFVQMHHMAFSNPQSTIVFNFLDNDEAVSKHLHDFYKKHKDIIPKNIELKLHSRLSEANSYKPIQGRRDVCHNYRDIARALIDTAAKQFAEAQSDKNGAGAAVFANLDDDLLSSLKKEEIVHSRRRRNSPPSPNPFQLFSQNGDGELDTAAEVTLQPEQQGSRKGPNKDPNSNESSTLLASGGKSSMTAQCLSSLSNCTIS